MTRRERMQACETLRLALKLIEDAHKCRDSVDVCFCGIGRRYREVYRRAVADMLMFDELVRRAV